jgi:hypothetical protein
MKAACGYIVFLSLRANGVFRRKSRLCGDWMIALLWKRTKMSVISDLCSPTSTLTLKLALMLEIMLDTARYMNLRWTMFIRQAVADDGGDFHPS